MKNCYFKYFMVLAVLGLLSFGWSNDAAAQNYATIGTGTSVSSVTWGTGTGISPFGTYYHDDRTQMLYTAAELTAAGAGGGAILSIGFDVAAVGGQSMNGFTIKIKNTTVTDLGTAYETGLTTVYTNANQSLVAGWNDFVLPVPFVWNGTDNLVVEVCFDNGSYTSNGTVYYSTTAFTSTRSSYCDSCAPGCSNTVSFENTYSERTNTRFDFVPPVANNAGVFTINSPAPGSCVIDSVVSMTMRNAGTLPLTSATINWSVNGVVQTPVSWTGNIASLSNDTVATVLGNFSFSNNDELVVWTTMPNGVPDSSNTGDTAAATTHAALSGVYSISNTSGTADYPDFSSAAQAVMDYGLCGSVTFNVDDGTYNEQFELGAYLGMSDSLDLTFQSASGNNTGVILTYSSTGGSDNYLVGLNGADNVHLKNMTLQNLGSGYSRVVSLSQEASDISIDGCILTSPTTTSSYNNSEAVIYANGQNHDNVHIMNNTINNGCYGVYMYGNNGNYGDGLVVKNNDILNSYQYGIYAYYQDGLELDHNYIATDNAYIFSYAMYVYYTVEGDVTNNYIDEAADSYYYGMYFYQAQGSLNKWYNISSNRSKFEYYGVYVSQGVFTAISNNTLFAASNASSSSRAAYITGGSVNQFFNNNIHNGSGGYAMYVSGNPLYISDHNNYYSSGTNAFYSGSAIADLAAWQTSTGLDSNSIADTATISDTASLISCGTSLDGAGMANQFSMMDYEGDMRDPNTPDIGADEFAALSTFTLGSDAVICDNDSIIMMTSFNSAVWNSTDTSANYTVTQAGTYTVEVSGFCGVASDTIVFSPQKYAATPAGANICDADSIGLDPGVLNGTYSWSTGETSNTIVVSAPGTYDVTVTDEDGCLSTSSTVVTQSPAVNLQDSVEFCQGASAFLDATISGTYTWDDGSTGQTRSVTASGTYTVTVTDPFNCVSTDQSVVTEVLDPVASFTHVRSFVTLTVTNTSQNIAHPSTTYLWDFGDGTTSTDENPGPHVYNLFNAIDTFDVSLTITNQCTNESDVQEVIIDYVSVEEITALNNVAMYPNPTNGVLNIDINVADASEFTMDVVNVSGQVILHKEFGTVSGQNNQVVDLSEVSAGVYFVKLKLNNESAVYRLIKE